MLTYGIAAFTSFSPLLLQNNLHSTENQTLETDTHYVTLFFHKNMKTVPEWNKRISNSIFYFLSLLQWPPNASGNETNV